MFGWAGDTSLIMRRRFLHRICLHKGRLDHEQRLVHEGLRGTGRRCARDTNTCQVGQTKQSESMEQ